MKEEPPFAASNYKISPDPHQREGAHPLLYCPRESLTRLAYAPRKGAMFWGQYFGLACYFPIVAS